MQDIEPELPPTPLFGEDQILVIERAVDDGTCERLCDFIERDFQRQACVEYKNHRTAYLPPPGEKMPALRELCARLFSEKIAPFFKAEMEWCENPQLLRYEKGGKYDAHSDSENWVNEGYPHWKKVHDRDISLLLYLNNRFAGGNLFFPVQNVTLAPAPGLLVAFPSHHGYKHAALPTEEGVRYVMAAWAAVKGEHRVNVKLPDHCFLMSDYRTN